MGPSLLLVLLTHQVHNASASNAAVVGRGVRSSSRLWPGVLDAVVDKHPEECLVHPTARARSAVEIDPRVGVLENHLEADLERRLGGTELDTEAWTVLPLVLDGAHSEALLLDLVQYRWVRVGVDIDVDHLPFIERGRQIDKLGAHHGLVGIPNPKVVSAHANREVHRDLVDREPLIIYQQRIPDVVGVNCEDKHRVFEHRRGGARENKRKSHNQPAEAHPQFGH